MIRGGPTILVALFLFTQATSEVGAQTSGQVWGNFTLDYPHGERLLYEVDFEPQVQYSGSDTWRSINVTPAIELSANRWIELLGQTAFARTTQSSEVTSIAVTPRVGARFHFFSNLRTMLPSRHRLGRVGVANLIRVEWRNLWYSDDTPSSHETRFRNRIELKAGINHAEMSLDRTFYFSADYEVFVPLSGDVTETFADKARTRVGLGYRRDRKWRFEVLYVRDATRQTEGGSFDTAANIVNFRARIFY